MKHARQMSVWGAVLVLAFMAAVGSPAAHGATEQDKQQAIDDGLAYLAGNQSGDGRWNYGDDYYDTAATGAALLAFLEEGYSAGTNVVIGGNDYGDVVGDGLNFLMTKAQTYGIGLEPAGNPDSDGNGIGVKFVLGGNIDRDTYVTGLVVPAIAATGTPNKLVTTGPLVGRTDGTGAGGAWTYKDVVQNSMDYFAYGQADPGNSARGGWRYYADYGQADNSTAQWPIIASLYAGSMGATTPAFVASELEYWINHIQNGDGGSDYDQAKTWGSNVTRTGSLLIQMKYAGYQGSGDPAVGNPFGTEGAAYQAALNYINGLWNTGPSATWNGNMGHPYAMWAVYKGLELGGFMQVNENGTPLDPSDDFLVGYGMSNAPGGISIGWDGATQTSAAGDWFSHYCEWLVNNQATNGSWGGYSYWTGFMATAWNINILAATQVPPPQIIPEPVTATGLLLGVGCLARYVRRRRSR